MATEAETWSDLRLHLLPVSGCCPTVLKVLELHIVFKKHKLSGNQYCTGHIKFAALPCANFLSHFFNLSW